MKDFISRHPLIASIALVALYDLGMQGLGAALSAASPGISYLSKGLIVEAAFCLLIVALIAGLRWRRDAGFRAPLTAASLAAYLPWLALPALMATDIPGLSAGAGIVIGSAAMMLMVGFGEEALLRGVILRALLPGGIMRAAVLSSVIFGLAHLSSILGGRDAVSSIVQATYATFIGIGFAGPRLFSGTIWPAIVIHGLIDFVDAAARGFVPATEAKPFTIGQAATVLSITGIYALYGLWLTWRIRKRMSKGCAGG